jgi:hypothetical protein
MVLGTGKDGEIRVEEFKIEFESYVGGADGVVEVVALARLGKLLCRFRLR